MFLLGHDLFLAGQILTVVTLAVVNQACTVFPFITKKELNPSWFGNKIYKLIILPLFAFRTLQQLLGETVLSAVRLFLVRVLSIFKSQSW